MTWTIQKIAVNRMQKVQVTVQRTVQFHNPITNLYENANWYHTVTIGDWADWKTKTAADVQAAVQAAVQPLPETIPSEWAQLGGQPL